MTASNCISMVGVYLVFLHARCCVVVSCSGLLRFASLIWLLYIFLSLVLLIMSMMAILCCEVFFGVCSYMSKSSGALFVEVVDTSVGMVAR